MKTILALFLVFGSAQSAWAGSENALLELQNRWAIANYQLTGDDQLKAFDELLVDAAQLAEKNPDSASLWTWNGIIQSTYAGVKGGLGALSYAENAKQSLEKSIEIDPNALHGAALTSLGTLYFKVPGWPIGFGDDDKAREFLEKGLSANPAGIDSNYFYAEFLRDQDDNAAAEKYLLAAQNAKPRPKRPVADSGRQGEISKSLEIVRETKNETYSYF